MKENIAKHIDVLFERYPELDFNREYIKKAYELGKPMFGIYIHNLKGLTGVLQVMVVQLRMLSILLVS